MKKPATYCTSPGTFDFSAFLMTLPSLIQLPKVYGATQIGNTAWSPFGPEEQNLIITVYGDFQAMFNAFTAGQVDITDWPVNPANLGTGSSAAFCDSSFNPDYFCTTPTSALDIFDLQINSNASVMGRVFATPRTTSSASLIAGNPRAAPCSTGFGSLSVTLENQETGNSIIKDRYNTLLLANQPSGSPFSTVPDSGGANPNGVYNTPCLLAGSYTLSTNIYSGTASTTILSNQNTSITFRVNWNSMSKVYTASARVSWGAALSHMLDRPAFASGSNGAVVSDNSFDPSDSLLTPTPTAGELTAADCFLEANTASANLHPWAPQCAGYPNGPFDPSAYNLVSDNIAGGELWWQITGGATTPGLGYSGHNDLRAACDDLVSMGLPLNPVAGAGGCENVANALSNSTLPSPWTSSDYPHVVPSGNIIFYITTTPGRMQFGTIIADTLNAMFGTPSSTGGGTVCYGQCPNPTPSYYTTDQVTPVIFGDGPGTAGGSGPNGWQLYTGGYSLQSRIDFVYGLFKSDFSGGTCGGLPEAQPNDYVFFCNPQFDTDSYAGEFDCLPSCPPASSELFFRRAVIDGMNYAMDVPIYTGIDTFVELNGWNFQQCTGSPCVNTQSSLVNTESRAVNNAGGGPESPFWTLLNTRQVPGYTPSNPIYSPGGGNANLIRMGFSQTTSHLSPFQFTTVWEADVVSEVFDSMLAVNPLNYTSGGQLLDWQTKYHQLVSNPTSTCNSPGTGPVIGCTTQTWYLRNDLKFQDGNSVTANDVAYSILAYRDVPSASLGPSVADVASAVGTDCGAGQPCKTLKVVLAHQSPFYELDIGGLPILEQSLWQPYCGQVETIIASPFENGIPSGSSSLCASLAFDPMSAINPLTGTPGIFVGDGPFSCVVPAGFLNTGHVGGSCTENSAGVLEGQAVGFGGRIVLTRNSLYFRCCPSGPGDTSSSLYKISYADKYTEGIVNILDLSHAAACFGLASGASNGSCSSADSAHWVNPNIAPGSTVNISDLATVAFYFRAGVTSYDCEGTGCYGNNQAGSFISPPPLTGVDPQIDPFNCPVTGC